jgi:hypothetical protein
MQSVSKQRFGKHVSAPTDTNAIIELFSMWFVPRCCRQDSLKQRGSCWLELSKRTWSSWFVQFSAGHQPVKGRPGGWYEMTASVGLSFQLTKSSVQAVVTRGPECGKLKNLPPHKPLPRNG